MNKLLLTHYYEGTYHCLWSCALNHCRSCGFSGPADTIAAANIAARAAVNPPYAERLTAVSASPRL
jgi:transposase